MDLTTGRKKMKMKNISIYNMLYALYKKFFECIWAVFWILSCYMMSHIKITVKDDKTEITCLCLFVIYLLWYMYPKPKNEYLCSIPLFLYIIGYYIIHWNSICEVTKILWNGIFG